MTLQAFTSNYADNSTEAGFQFTFFCDHCRDGFKSRFIESKTYKRGSSLKNLGRFAAMGASLLGQHRVGYSLERGANTINQRHQGMSPQWHKEHEAAFELAQNEVKERFNRCPKCINWVCASDWNEQEGLCVKCAPRVNVEVAAARGQRMVEDIKSKAKETTVFTGEIESKQTLCPRCQKPAGEGNFCNNCGANLSLLLCEKCGAESPSGTRFCGQCGNRLE